VRFFDRLARDDIDMNAVGDALENVDV